MAEAGLFIVRQTYHKEAAGSASSHVARHSFELLRCVSEQDAGVARAVLVDALNILA